MRLVLFTLGLFFSLQLSAGVYKCIDASGNKIYSAAPCLEGQSKLELNVKSGSSKDLKALEQQEQLDKQAQEAKDTQKKQEEEAAVKQQEEFKQSVIQESATNQTVIKNNPKQYSAYAIPPYKPDNLSPLLKSFESRLADIERFRRLAAEKALASNECGRVESVELSTKSKAGTLVILVDCSTAKKFYITEQELASTPIPTSDAAAPPAAPVAEVTPTPTVTTAQPATPEPTPTTPGTDAKP